MTNPLNLLTQAVTQGQAQDIYAQVTTPTPSSFTDPLYVIIPDWSSNYSFKITNWPRIHGNSLPLAGAAVLLATDSRGNRRVTWWDGINT